MKLKVLFILPVLIFSSIWWAPLAVADTTPSSSGGDLQYGSVEKIATLKKKIEELKTKLANAKSETDAAYDKSINAVVDKLKFCGEDPSSAKFNTSQCLTALNASMSAKSEYDTAKIAQDFAEKALATAESELASLEGISPTGANEQGVSNYQSGGTVLPDTKYQNIADCETVMRYVNIHTKEIKAAISGRVGVIDMPAIVGTATTSYLDIMGCAIKTGDVKFWMIPYFARYILEFIIAIAGLASVGGLVYGGYLYLFAGLSDDQQKGKNAIKGSLIGLILSLSAWAIVNIVISLVTSI
ncbi:pilin [Candidatus Gracilibacteria bacterium]|nr:pilin [Candidatus Gracilibacteria bacterium]